MGNCAIEDVLNKAGDKLIYVYDFFSMWAFFIELSQIDSDHKKGLPKTVLAIGNVRDEPPEKDVIAEPGIEDFSFHADSSELENLS